MPLRSSSLNKTQRARVLTRQDCTIETEWTSQLSFVRFVEVVIDLGEEVP